jgi:hypothetical protein
LQGLHVIKRVQKWSMFIKSWLDEKNLADDYLVYINGL